MTFEGDARDFHEAKRKIGTLMQFKILSLFYCQSKLKKLILLVFYLKTIFRLLVSSCSKKKIK